VGLVCTWPIVVGEQQASVTAGSTRLVLARYSATSTVTNTVSSTL
jgi:hypothetical protein